MFTRTMYNRCHVISTYKSCIHYESSMVLHHNEIDSAMIIVHAVTNDLVTTSCIQIFSFLYPSPPPLPRFTASRVHNADARINLYKKEEVPCIIALIRIWSYESSVIPMCSNFLYLGIRVFLFFFFN